VLFRRAGRPGNERSDGGGFAEFISAAGATAEPLPAIFATMEADNGHAPEPRALHFS
jgi:hypothetical protein